ncbi:hypothetical protein CHS0354_001272 [Potamilus streckersoni]|uniref:Uncharacterized protein n=1 Tax=Potamilus streckersoni TaxID=2493646 RepID=A0AAE0VQB6_9BIVA|nr:hypothetical protein CHS0354_001272 [Potamilus streckersoni]
MVAVLAPKVLDGTRCDYNSLDMCINGRCWKVGCDHKLDSNAKLDSCGVCGGNDTCIQGNRGDVGRYRWIQTGYSECSVTCGVGHQEPRFICFDGHLGRVLDSSFCVNLITPSMENPKCDRGSCPPEWRVGPWQNCTKSCGGGQSWRIVTCIKTFEDGMQQWVRDSFCNNLKPSARKSCNNHICPTWHAGEWSVCSVSCGSGYQHREVICRHVGDTFCDVGEKPRVLKNCTTGILCYNLSDDIQELGELTAGKTGTFVLGDDADSPDLRTPQFATSEWGPCSASCGKGTRFRYVRCQVYLRFLEAITDLPDTDCDSTKPLSTEECEVEPCFDDFEWRASGMTPCSRSCLGGVQETLVTCVYKYNGTDVGDEYCVEAPHVPKERRICNDFPCPQRWRLEEFGPCSSSCGGGNMHRKVECVQQFAHGADNILTLPDIMCSDPLPIRQKTCNIIDCPAEWTTGKWSQCSVSCGIGVMTRAILCEKVNATGQIFTISRDSCLPELEPEMEMACNKSVCPTPLIKTEDIQFFQLQKMNRIRLVVGMQALVFPGASVLVKCPTQGLDQEKIYWLRNGTKLKGLKRVKVSKSGTLRIRSIRPVKDGGVYTCVAGDHHANISIEFSTSYDVIQAKVFREQTYGGVDETFENGSVLVRDPLDRKLKPLQLLATDWTLCSVSCGGGLQSRNVSCELVSQNYYEVFPVSDCTRDRSTGPSRIRSCNTEPCVKWRAGNWSECSDTECVRNLFSIQHRTVECILEFNGTALGSKHCSALGFPPDSIKDCLNRNCTAVWNASKWSECVGECGKKGYKTRMLNCIWAKSGARAPHGSCDSVDVPKVFKRCNTIKCPDVLKDESSYCSVVKALKMCQYENYQRKCRKTCATES